MDNWGNSPNQPNQSNSSGNAAQAANNLTTQGILVNEKGLKNAVQKKAFLLQNLVKYMKYAKAGINIRSEQTRTEHQRTIERMKYELAEYEKRATLELNYWNTQHQRVEAGMTDTAQVIVQLSAALQTITTQNAPVLLRDLLMPDYSWLDSIVEKINVPASVTEDWSKLKQNVFKWNILMNQICKKALYQQSPAPPMCDSFSSSQSPPSNSLQYTQTLQSAQLSNHPGATPNVCLVPPTNSFPSVPNGALQHANLMPVPGTSASCSQVSQPFPSQNTNPNCNPPTYSNALEMQNRLLRDLLNNPNTVTQVSQSRTQVLLNGANSSQSAGVCNQQSQHQNNIRDSETQEQLRLQQQKLLHLKQMELQTQRRLQLQQQNLNPLPISAPSIGSNSHSHHHESINTCATLQTQTQHRENCPCPATRTGSTGEECTLESISCVDDDDCCEVIEEQDPLADTSPPSGHNGPEMFAPLNNQSEIQTLAKAQRLGTEECCSGIFEEETTEVIHLENETPMLVFENSISPPYSDLSDQEQTQVQVPSPCLPNSHSRRRMQNGHKFASIDMANNRESVINPPQSIGMKRYSTGSINDPHMNKTKMARSDSSDAPSLNPPVVNEISKSQGIDCPTVQRSQSMESAPADVEQSAPKPMQASPTKQSNQKRELPENITTFEDLRLDARLVSGLKELGFHELTPAQKLGFPAFLKRKELLLVAERCFGKTTMALVGLLHQLNLDAASGCNLGSDSKASLQAIIITSSMTSGFSIKEQFNKLAAFTPRSNSNTSFKAVCTTESVFGNGHVLIGDPPAMKRFFTLQQEQADPFNKARNIKCIVIDNTERMKPEFFSMMIGIIYSRHIRGDAQVVVLTRTLEVPGFAYLRKLLRTPQLISVPMKPRLEKSTTLIPGVNTCDRTRDVPSPPVLSMPDPKETNLHEFDESFRSASPPVMSIPETRSETAAQEAPFFLAEMTITTSENSDPQQADSISNSFEINPVTCESEVCDRLSPDVVEEAQPASPEKQPVDSHPAVPLSPASSDPVTIAPLTSAQATTIVVTEPAITTAPIVDVSPLGPTSLTQNTVTAQPRQPSSIQVPVLESFHDFQHFYCEASDLSDKIETVHALASTIMIGQALIFCSKTECGWLMSEFSDNENLLCRAISDFIDESEMLAHLKAFDNGELKALILPDHIAENCERLGRLKKVPFILNFDCPEDDSVYLRRSSFATFKQTDTPEEGQNVIVLSFAGDENELSLLKEIEKKYNISITDASSQDDE